MSTTYIVICVFAGDNTAFLIQIESGEIIGFLKERIKEKAPNELAGVDPHRLQLYRVEIPDDEDMVEAVVQKLSEHPRELRTTERLADVFKDGLKEGTVHIIVQPPKSDGQLELHPEFDKFVDAVKFFTGKMGTYTVEDLRDRSNSTHLHEGARVASSLLANGTSSGDDHQTPSFVSAYLEKLDGKRPASQAQLQQLQQLPEIFGQTTCEDHFEVSDPEEREMSSYELDTYTMRLRFHHHCLDRIRQLSSSFKDSHVTIHLVDPALTDTNEAWCYNKNVGWDPVLLQGTIGNVDDRHLCKLKSGSDFSLAKTTYGPLIMGEVASDAIKESDRWRMLFEGIAVCRYQNMIRGDREAITLCLYLNKAYEMERYLVYQDADTNSRGVHVLHDLTLDLREIPDTFLLSKQLFNFRERLIRIPEEKVRNRLEEVLNIQKEIENRYNTLC